MHRLLSIIGLVIVIDAAIAIVWCIYWAIRTHGFKE